MNLIRKLVRFATAALLGTALLAASPARSAPPNTISGSVAICDPWDPRFCAVSGNQFHLIAANSNNSTLIGTGTRMVSAVQLSGIGAAPAYLKFYDKATAPTCGTDTPTKVLMIPAASTAALGAGSNVTIMLGARFLLGLGICVVTGIADNDNTAPAAATFVINFDWD